MHACALIRKMEETKGHHTIGHGVATLRTGADMCKAGAASGARCIGTRTQPDRIRSSHELPAKTRPDCTGGATRGCCAEGVAGGPGSATLIADGGWRVHAEEGVPGEDAATGAKHCNFMRQAGVYSV